VLLAMLTRLDRVGGAIMSVGGAYDDDRDPEGDGIRRPVGEWTDAYARAMLRLARRRMAEIDPTDPTQARSWGAVLAICAAIISELEVRLDLYAEVERSLAGAVCPCCRRPLEGDRASA
jgi:hypothetical protein